MKYVCALALLLSGTPFAADLGPRVAEGKAAASTEEGKKYDLALAPFISEAMLACIPPGTTDPGNLGSFVVVANVSGDGLLSRVEFSPTTVVARCFAEKFQTFRLPIPPSVPTSSGGFPIEVSMSVKP